MPYRLGVDVGGTFTDLLMIDENTGETWRAKTPSTPADPSIGVLAGWIIWSKPEPLAALEHTVEVAERVGGPAARCCGRWTRTAPGPPWPSCAAARSRP
jgi:predicted NBD/HSP70 family sugar kinase